jgi:toxin ParE1/3/4
MNKLTILISDQAKLDLEDIWLYIASDNIEAADSLYNLIDIKIHLLSESPRIGKNRSEIAEGILSFPIGNYIIFYQIIDKGVLILRVLHGKRDISNFIDES